MSTPLRDLITSLAHDADSRAAFAADPGAFLAEHGWSELDGQDVGTALGALAAEAPIEQAVRLDELATDSFDGGIEGAIAGLGVAAEVVGEAPAPSNGHGDDPLDRDPSLGLDVGHGSGNGAEPAPGGDDDGSGGAFRLAPDHEPGETGEALATAAAPDSDEIPADAAGPDGIDDLPDDADKLPADAARLDELPDAAQTHADATAGPDDLAGADQLPADAARLASEPDDGELGDGEPGPVLGDPLAGLDPVAEHEGFIQPDEGDGDIAAIPEPESEDDL